MYEFPSGCRGCKYKKICKTLPKDLTCLEVAIIAEQDEKDEIKRKGRAKMGLQAFDLYPRKCKFCGKHFESCKEYAYKAEKRKGKKEYFYFCSWRCLQLWRELRRKAV